MQTLNIPNQESSKKEILKYINAHTNSDLICWNKSMNEERLLELVDQLVESESNPAFQHGSSTDVVLPEIIELKEGSIILKNEKRKEIIKDLFVEFGSKHGFIVKEERKHDYTQFDEERLLKHILWWFLVKSKKIPQKDLTQIWKTNKIAGYFDQLKTDPIIKKYITLLFDS